MKTLILCVAGVGLGAIVGLAAAQPPAGAPNSLDGWQHAQTKPALKEYTQRIQPILMNGCGTGACHGGDQPRGGFLLHRPPGLAATPQHTLKNLAQTVALIDKQDASRSQLLKKALEAHGGAERAPLGGQDQPAYLALAAWVRQVAPPPAGAEPQAFGPPVPSREGPSGFAGSRAPDPAPPDAKPNDSKSAEMTKEEALKQLLERKTPGAAPTGPPPLPTIPPLPGTEEFEKLKNTNLEGLLQTGAPPMLGGGQNIGRPATPEAPPSSPNPGSASPAAPVPALPAPASPSAEAPNEAPKPAAKKADAPSAVPEAGDPYDPAAFNEWARKKQQPAR